MVTADPAAEPKVYVDPAIWPFGRMKMCHMWSPDLERLHAMAKKLALKREWFQDKPSFPHYDICQTKRHQAILEGAIPITSRRMIEMNRALRKL